jgi:hypothetical protein
VKRALWLLPVPLAAVALAVLTQRMPEPRAAAPAADEPAQPVAVTTGPTWVATKTPPRPPRGALPAPAPRETTGPKPITASREALMDSHPPVVATLSIDQLGSPRERLLATHGTGEARQAQLGRLSDRTAAYLEKLRAERAQATGDERTRLTQTIKTLERNQSMRTRIMTTGVHVPARPGTVAWNVAAKQPPPQN